MTPRERFREKRGLLIMAKAKEQIPSFRTHPAMQHRWDALGRKMAFQAKTIAEWKRWRTRLIRKLKQLIGYDTMERCPLRARITGEVDCPDHVRQRVEITTSPGVLMPLYVLIPKSAQAPYPAVLTPHGHSSGGKVAVAGIREHPEVARTIVEHNYDYGVQFARAGCITFCPDARGFGERQEKMEEAGVLESSCRVLNNMAMPLGQTVTGMWTWDLHRLIDYVETRPDVRPGKLGCAGLSGGGLQTLWAAALDTRITCAIISGYFYGCRESLLDKYENCDCNYVAHLWEYADMGDIGAAIAPRELLIETGTKDELNGASGVANVKSQVRIVRRAYRLLGAHRNIRHVIFEGEHRWGGSESIPWMKKRLD